MVLAPARAVPVTGTGVGSVFVPIRSLTQARMHAAALLASVLLV